MTFKGSRRLPASPACIEPARGLALATGTEQLARVTAVLDERTQDEIAGCARPLPVLAGRLSEARP
jgi:hypothetical protein